MQTVHHEFAYECPHCHETIRISEEALGNVVDCPVCDNPFHVDIPIATPADPRKVSAMDIDDLPGIDGPEHTEGDLKVVHPAMFRAHPIKFLMYSAMLVAGVATMILSMWNFEFISQTVQLATGGFLVLLGAGLLAQWWVRTRFTELRVTSKRTILRRGLIARHTTEVQHDDVRNIQVNQSTTERLLGVGDLAISSSGQDDLEIYVQDVPKPHEVADIIRDLQ